MSGNHKLEGAQQWLLAAITSRQPPSQTETHDWLAGGPQQTPSERLSVYRHAYLARLLEVLREQFPCTRFAAGDEHFDALIVDYLQHCPPHSYTLAKLADRLVEHLEATRPADWGAFLVELARLEEAIDRVFDGPGGENLPPLTLPDLMSDSLQLTLTPGLELLAFCFPASTFYSDWKHGRRPQWPRPRAQHVALVRRDYVVRRYELSQPQYELLKQLQAGQTLDDALAALVRDDIGMGDLATCIQQWFAFWTAEHFFAAIQVTPADA